jgi:hypothetical protein
MTEYEVMSIQKRIIILKDKLSTYKEVLPKCSGEITGGSGSFRKHNPCDRIATWTTPDPRDDLFAYCEKHVLDQERDKSYGYTQGFWALNVRDLEKEIESLEYILS